ncbi:MAG: DNA recombination protein RmuC [Kiritimatiellae bacterium]|nr:DNA recombination protein RmuC [Kiritimatiellia bacterium]MCO5060877.1 DNA recombination protein RmuC [Kiritimatiellia bacterium]MCO5069414.1 DNA recombination protein RmuC [Kiritimatiellia bacterium]MCO6401737.1 DNA recombination protein RmuC [Verrucomicrobiota bacterium]
MPDIPVPLLLALLILVLAGFAFWVRSQLRALRERADEQQALAELKGQVGGFALQVESLRDSIASLQGQVVQSLDGTRQAMDQRLDSAAHVISGVRQNLGELAEKTQTLAEIGKDIASLQDILRSPKLRGTIGELFLSNLLAQVLPAPRFTLQHRFRSGEIVDAVVKLHAGLVPVDAKFPLENFRRALSAETAPEKKAARRRFIQDVKRHVDAIAEKYIRPDEGTFDFAMMYIPAENVYYEAIVKGDDSDAENALLEYAIRKRVIPVSPSSFFAYLQTILLGLKGLRIEENARAIVQQLHQTQLDFEKFDESFRLVGTHLDNARAKHDEALKHIANVKQRISQISSDSGAYENPTSSPSG